MKRYDQMTDEQLIVALRNGESEITDYIMEKYKHLVRKRAKAMFLIGGENDDLIQEGMIGLFKAVRDYDIKQGVSFESFARLCISRQIYSAIEASKRKKHMPLNSYISLYEAGETNQEEKSAPLIESIEPIKENNPETLLLDKEYMELIEARLEEKLSDLEGRVLYLHLLGMDYQKIARFIDKSPKAVDNALQRIKAKVQEIAELKMPDLNAASLEAAMSMIAGTARSMGVEVEK